MDSLFNDIVEKFTKSQKRLYKKLQHLVGEDTSIRLIELLNRTSTSQNEILFIATLISRYRPFTVISSPSSLTLKADVEKGYEIYVYFQYEVRQPDTTRNTNSKKWSVDLVIKLIVNNCYLNTEVATIGYEFDGHPQHSLQNGVISDKIRDAGIMQEEGFNPIRVPLEAWNTNPLHFKKCLDKFIDRSILKFEQLFYKNYEHQESCSDSKEINYEIPLNCLLCNGKGKFGGRDCPECNGMGALSKAKNKKIDLSKYDRNLCPECSSASQKCKICNGKEFLTREDMLAIG